MTTIYLHNFNDPIEHAVKFDSLQLAALHVLNYDMQDAGIELDDGRYVPWQKSHSGVVSRWTAVADYDIEKVWWSIVYDIDGPFVPMTARDHMDLLAEMNDIDA